MGDARVAHARPEQFAATNHGFAWIRMIGALVVIYGHSSPLVGAGELFPPEWPIQPDEGVLMGFFAMSGFQITESWMRDPHPARFAAKRVLRLWPPMLTVSFGMALIVGPLVTSLTLSEYFAAEDTWGYIVNNAGLLTLQHDLPGVFGNNPWSGAVNGSLWTLPMELLAYGGLYAVLLLGAAKDRWRWLALAALVALIAWDRHLEDLAGAESAGSLLSVPVESLVAFLVAFAAGVVLNLYRIPLSPTAAVVGLVVLALMPNSIVGSFWMTFAVSYAVIVGGHFWPARLEIPGVWVNGSYGVYVWGFPVQQLLAMGGIRNQYLMLLCAAPIAYILGTLSWKFVEEPTMQLRHYITPAQRSEPAAREDDGDEDRDDRDDWDEERDDRDGDRDRWDDWDEEGADRFDDRELRARPAEQPGSGTGGTAPSAVAWPTRGQPHGRRDPGQQPPGRRNPDQPSPAPQPRPPAPPARHRRTAPPERQRPVADPHPPVAEPQQPAEEESVLMRRLSSGELPPPGPASPPPAAQPPAPLPPPGQPRSPQPPSAQPPPGPPPPGPPPPGRAPVARGPAAQAPAAQAPAARGQAPGQGAGRHASRPTPQPETPEEETLPAPGRRPPRRFDRP
ncbi:acyltransferase family protein [Parasphingorhabdus pacifica]